MWIYNETSCVDDDEMMPNDHIYSISVMNLVNKLWMMKRIGPIYNGGIDHKTILQHEGFDPTTFR